MISAQKRCLVLNRDVLVKDVVAWFATVHSSRLMLTEDLPHRKVAQA